MSANVAGASAADDPADVRPPVAAARSCSIAGAPTLVVEVGRLFTGREVLHDVRIVIAGHTIVSIEPRAKPLIVPDRRLANEAGSVPTGPLAPGDQNGPRADQGACRVYAFAEATALPGLIDAHVHLYLLARAALKATQPAQGSSTPAPGSPGSPDGATLLSAAVAVAETCLRRGVTTVRDLGDRQRLNLQVRRHLDERAERGVPGPRVLAPGRALHRAGRYGSFIGAAASGADGLLNLADEELDAGADFVKVVASGIIDFRQAAVTAPVPFTAPELRMLVDRVHARGKPVAAHASGAAGVAAAVEAGADFLEHGFFAADGPGSPVAAFMSGRCTWVPTFIPVEVVGAGAALPELTDEERAGVRRIVERHAVMLRAVHEAGGAAIAGSDAGSPGVWEAGGIVGELRCYQRAGLPLRSALALATLHAAEALGISHLTGSVEPGKRADLLVVGGNPLDSLDALSDVRLVVRDGVPVNGAMLPAPGTTR